MPVRSFLRRFGVLVCLLVSLASTPVVAGAQEPSQLSVATDATYVADPDGGVVEVRFAYEFENRTTDVAFPGFFESLPASVATVVVSDGRQTLEAAPFGEDAGFTVWLVAFDQVLDPGERVTVTLDWVMEAGAGDEPPIIEPGALAFDVYVPGPADATWNPPTIEVPEGFVAVGDAAATAGPYQPTSVAYLDREHFTARTTASSPELTVADWATDGAWLSSVMARAVEVTSTLDTWFGPRADPLEIRRGLPLDEHPELSLSTSPAHVVVVGDTASAVDHQLAHAWLADVPVDEEWFIEGLAAAFAGDTPDPVAPAEIVPPLADEMGPAGVRAVVDALRSSSITYPGFGSEPQPLPPDWRTLLDLVEGVGGATDAAPLFRAAVVDDAGVAEIDRRAAARVDYLALAERAEPWLLPPLVRVPMAEWDFDTFAARQSAVSDSLVVRDGLRTWAEGLELELGDDVRRLFETAEDDMTEVDALLELQLEALEAFADAERLVNGDRGLLARVGLLRSDPDGDLEALRAAWAAGDYEAVVDGGHELADLVEGSVGAGTVRLLVPIVVALGIWQLLRWLLARVRPGQVVDS